MQQEQAAGSKTSFPFEWWDGINAHLKTIKKQKPTLKLKRFLLSASRTGYRLRGYYNLNGKEVSYDATSKTVKDLPDKLTSSVLAAPTSKIANESEANRRRTLRASFALKTMTKQLYETDESTLEI